MDTAVTSSFSCCREQHSILQGTRQVCTRACDVLHSYGLLLSLLLRIMIRAVLQILTDVQLVLEAVRQLAAGFMSIADCGRHGNTPQLHAASQVQGLHRPIAGAADGSDRLSVPSSLHMLAISCLLCGSYEIATSHSIIRKQSELVSIS